MNYYDNNIYYDDQYNQIVTSSEKKLAILKLDESKITVNGTVSGIKGAAINVENLLYLSEGIKSGALKHADFYNSFHFQLIWTE